MDQTKRTHRSAAAAVAAVAATAVVVTTVGLLGTASATGAEVTSGGAGAARAATPRPSPVAFDAEELRYLDDALGAGSTIALIRAAGLGPQVSGLTRDLYAGTAEAAVDTASRAGRDLWATARTAAQAPGSSHEDRGLYWARLAGRIAIKRYLHAEGAAPATVEQALASFEHGSRGITGEGFDDADGARHVFVSGFDPFALDNGTLDVSNPSGAAALALDGRSVDTPDGPVHVRAVVLPVTWAGFDAGIVEQAFGPVLRSGGTRVDAIVTISQGAFTFDVERWAGGHRGGLSDNRRETSTGDIPESPAHLPWPQAAGHQQFIETTLPVERMLAAGQGEHRVRYNETYCAAPTPARDPKDEICGEGEPPVSTFAVIGSGGDFLSNESMYRANRLRLVLGRSDVAGGHLHVPIPGLTPEGQLVDFEASRRAIVAQTERLVAAAAPVAAPAR